MEINEKIINQIRTLEGFLVPETKSPKLCEFASSMGYNLKLYLCSYPKPCDYQLIIVNRTYCEKYLDKPADLTFEDIQKEKYGEDIVNNQGGKI